MEEKMQPAVVFDHVSKEYTLYRDNKEQFLALFHHSKNLRKHMALKDVSLTIQKGESVGIIGNNGAGKSTMLKMITGVAFPTSGEVTVNGRVAALLELTAGFSDEMTGRENIYLKGYLLGLTDEYIRSIEERIIAFAELGDYIDQPVRTYSSGMKMRLGFAVNINTDPEILVVDEALSVGDASFKKKCKEAIAEMVRQTGAPQFDQTGMMIRGTIVRHLMLPGLAGDTAQVLRYLAEHFGDRILVSLMRQYTPFGMAERYPELDRKITDEEYEQAVALFSELGLAGFLQDKESISESFIPSFEGQGV